MLTRSPQAIAAYAAALAARGFVVVALPVTRTAPAAERDQERLARALARLDFYDAIVVASARAAQVLLDGVGDLARLRGANAPRLWAVGSATAWALAARGVMASTPPKCRASCNIAPACWRAPLFKKRWPPKARKFPDAEGRPFSGLGPLTIVQ